jgi:hypothetical protein
MSEDISMDQIQKNWKFYSTLLNRLEDTNITNLLNSLGERLAISPANRTRGEYGAFAGGLVDTACKLGKAMQALNEFHGNPVSIKSIYKVGLLHDIGRIGTLDKDYFEAQTSDWHREKLGHMFKINEEIKTTHLQRTLYILSQFQIVLSEEEFNALLGLDDKEAKNQLGAILLHARNMLENEEQNDA